VVAVILRIGRAAIHAAKIASIRDRNSQIRNLSPEFVVKRHRHRLPAQKTKKARIRWLDVGHRRKSTYFRRPSFPNTGGLDVSAQTLITGCPKNAAAEASPPPP
jgi:hypothetical protein